MLLSTIETVQKTSCSVMRPSGLRHAASKMTKLCMVRTL